LENVNTRMSFCSGVIARRSAGNALAGVSGSD